METKLDAKNKVPLYIQLMNTLIRKIETHDYHEHDRLPSERELCEIYQLSRITVRQALQELEREGYIYKLHGKGTFVASKAFNQNLSNLYSFTEEMKKIGKTPTSKVISFLEMAADEQLAKKMELEPLEDVFQVIRLRLADDLPLMYETSYLPKRFFPKLTQEKLNQQPMYDIFSEDYQIVVSKVIEQFTATIIRKEEADHLQIESYQPGLLVKRFSYYNDKLIEYTISIARGDKFTYTVQIQ